VMLAEVAPAARGAARVVAGAAPSKLRLEYAADAAT
jgi:hypothetical protein